MKQHIYTTRSKFLTFAAIHGTNDLSLERTIEKYQIEGNYKFNFGEIKENNNDEFIVGVPDKPILGCLRITHKKDRPHYVIGATAYGEGAHNLLLDYISAAQLTSEEQEKMVGFTRAMELMLGFYDMLLGREPNDGARRKYYSELIEIERI